MSIKKPVRQFSFVEKERLYILVQDFEALFDNKNQQFK